LKKLLLLVVTLAAVNAALFTLVRSRRSENPTETTKVHDSEAPGTGVRLQWDATPDPRVLEYRIYVSSEPGNYNFEEPTATVPPGVTEWSVSGLLAGRYFAVVTAATSTEESPPTEEIEFTVP